jgi:hypothetical protein
MKFGGLCFAFLLLGSTAAFAVDPASVPAPKQTKLGQYFSAQEAAGYVSNNPSKTLFLDVRTPAELMFVGMPTIGFSGMGRCEIRFEAREKLRLRV